MASNVSPPQEHDPIHGSSKLQVTILASEWGSTKGGLSTINRELAIQLAKFSYVEVTFFLPKCSDEDKKAADSHGISILEAARLPGFNELDQLCFPPENLRIDVVVGHGIKLGRQAQVIRNSHKCKWVQVVHTDSEELGMYKCYEKPIATGEEKHRIEVKLCQMADFVVAVGPKLTEAFRGYLGWCKKDVFEFTPGVFADFSSVELVTVKRRQCRVLVFGRGDAEDFELKGFDIAARSVAALSDSLLYFVGVPHGKHEDMSKRFVDLGIPKHRQKVRRYLDSREDLKQLFCEVDLVLMPSRTDGFGLTGLEALSAGIPVIVSKNSGFGEALGSVPFGSLFVIDSEDPSAWRKAIRGIWDKDRKQQLDEVKDVRGSYGKQYSWFEQCKSLIEKMFKLVDGTSSELDITAPVAEARKQKLKEDFTDHSPRVPPKAKRGKIEKSGREQLAGLDGSVSFKPGALSQYDVFEIAHELGASWKMFGRLLNVPNAVIDQIEANKSNVSDKCYSILRRWQEMYPSDATYQRLARALQHPTIDRVDVAVKYCGRQFGTDVETAKDAGSPVPAEIRGRGPEAERAFQKAMKSGKVKVYRGRIMLLGQDRAGKTSLKKSLLGLPFDPDEESTVGVEMDKSKCELEVDEVQNWMPSKRKKGEMSEFEEELAKFIVRSLTESEADDNNSPATDPNVEEVTITDELEERKDYKEPNLSSDVDEPVTDTEEEIMIVEDGQKAFSEQKSVDKIDSNELQLNINSTTLPKDVTDLIANDATDLVVRYLQSVQLEDDIKSKEVILTLWDFAGQHLYYASHSVFLSGRAVYILVYNLSNNLLAMAEPCVRQGIIDIPLDNPNDESNLDNLLSWLVSVHCIRSDHYNKNVAHKGTEQSYLRPPVIIVGTNSDQPFEAIETTENYIKNSILNKEYEGHVIAPFFAVNNTTVNDEGVQNLRHKVMKVLKDEPYMGEEVPLRWFNFERVVYALVAKQTYFMDLDRLLSVIEQVCHIKDEKEVTAVLNFYHDLGVIVKHGRTVVLQAQWLIDLFKHLITVPPFDEADPSYRKWWRDLEVNGILRIALVDHVFSKFIDKGLCKQDILDMMELHGLIAKFSIATDETQDEQRYFVPTQLTSSPSALCEIKPSGCDPCPLVLNFLDGFVPHGLFPQLVSKFIHWCSENGLKETPQLFNNGARLFIGKQITFALILICRKRFIKIVLKTRNPSSNKSQSMNASNKMAIEVRNFIERTLDGFSRDLSWLSNLRYELSVVCTYCLECTRDLHKKTSCDQDDCLHLLRVRPGEELICLKNFCDETVSPGWEMWFEVPHTQTMEPEEDTQIVDGTSSEPEITSQEVRARELKLNEDYTDPGSSVPAEIMARGLRAEHAFQMAMQNGKVKVYRARMMLLGQDRAGKTSLRKSLLGLPFDPEEESTVGVEVDEVKNWMLCKKGEVSEHKDEIARFIVRDLNKPEADGNDSTFATVEEVKTTNQLEEKKDHHEPKLSPDRDKPATDTEEVEDGHQALSEENLVDKNKVSNELELNINLNVTDIVVRYLQSLRLEDDTKSEEVILTLWDFAGQHIYYASHSVFLSGRAVYILVYNLNKDLVATAEPCARQGMNEILLENPNDETNLDNLLSWLVSVHNIRSAANKNVAHQGKKLSYLQPPVIIVGTNLDQPFKEVKTTEKDIKDSMLGKEYAKHVVSFFAVDNKTENDEGVQELRQRIMEVLKEEPYMGEEVPLRWFKFERAVDALVAKQTYFMDRDQLLSVIRQVCDIEDEEEVTTMLNFYHDLGVIVKHRGTVVLQVQWLIDLFKQLITVRPFDEANPLYLNCWRDLEKNGILRKDLVDHVFSKFVNKDPLKQDILDMMEQHGLIAKFSIATDENQHEQMYFVPTQLRSSPSALCEIKPSKCDPCPLVLHFLDGFVPHGLFPQLVPKFIHWCSENGFKKTPQLFNNGARLFIGKQITFVLILICRKRFIKIVLKTRNPSSCKSLSMNASNKMAIEVRNFIKETLDGFSRDLSYLSKLRHVFSVVCTHCQQRESGLDGLMSCCHDDRLHLLRVGPGEELICMENFSNETVKVPGWKMWFEESHSQTKEPKEDISDKKGQDFLSSSSFL
ncbi:PREDICTED: uncharacterized protein LOC107347432 isoform X3 [Acropora digitifera]|uniref:uncharacterized protein LOC107347416 isoform X3 n=1 Tax=Acropora digitifera TaxID=70779 RepID=UPI00077AC16B|nr:PREDICTED: uncharacterized protein LOC107347416 isoform X3 [Acropora digitifera]XP_015768832.1 PREDICTED: uncharacterized protein LOC107347432 isoform X3 [Acropora digitifera]